MKSPDDFLPLVRERRRTGEFEKIASDAAAK
jgi:hypothetical protein